jgi:hypothetical protein
VILQFQHNELSTSRTGEASHGEEMAAQRFEASPGKGYRDPISKNKLGVMVYSYNSRYV